MPLCFVVTEGGEGGAAANKAEREVVEHLPRGLVFSEFRNSVSLEFYERYALNCCGGSENGYTNN